MSTLKGKAINLQANPLFTGGPVFAASVPDTGVTQCYDDAGNVITCSSEGHRFYGEDGNYTLNLPI